LANAIESKDELLSRLRTHADDLDAFDVETIALFGSFVREEARPDSDVDLLIEFAPGEKSFDKFMELNFFLEDLLGRSVELLPPESLDDAFAEAIEEELEYIDGTEQVSPSTLCTRRSTLRSLQSWSDRPLLCALNLPLPATLHL